MIHHRNWTPLLLFLLCRLYSAFSCIYFIESDVSNQMLVIRRDMENYCFLNKTSPGENVTCADNATAMIVNHTHVLVYTKKGDNGSFVMEYGKGNEPGKYSYPHQAACPVSPVPPENLKEATKNHRARHGLYGTLCLAILLLIIIPICMKCKNGKPRINYPGESCVSKKSNYDKLAMMA